MILYFNICSFYCNLDSLIILFKNVDLRFFFIGIIEIWFWDLLFYIDILGYNFVYNFCKDRIGGGVGLYLVDNFDFKCWFDLVFFCIECVEFLFVEINRLKEKNIIVGVVYRLFN